MVVNVIGPQSPVLIGLNVAESICQISNEAPTKRQKLDIAEASTFSNHVVKPMQSANTGFKKSSAKERGNLKLDLEIRYLKLRNRNLFLKNKLLEKQLMQRKSESPAQEGYYYDP